MTYTIIIILLLAVFYLLTLVSKLDSQLKGIKYILEQVAQKVDIPEYPVNDQLRQLIMEGKDVEAVKRARETLGLSLVEGKHYIDSLKTEKG